MAPAILKRAAPAPAPKPKASLQRAKRAATGTTITVVQQSGSDAGTLTSSKKSDAFNAQEFLDEYDPAMPNDYHSFLNDKNKRMERKKQEELQKKRSAAPAPWSILVPILLP